MLELGTFSARVNNSGGLFFFFYGNTSTYIDTLTPKLLTNSGGLMFFNHRQILYLVQSGLAIK